MALSTVFFDQISTSVQTFNWHSPSWDLFIVLAWIIGSLVYAIATGRGRVVNMLFSIYIAKLLVFEAPWLTKALSEKLPTGLISMQLLISFILIFLILFMLLGRYGFRTSVDGRQLSHMPFTFIFSFLQVGLLINIIVNFIPSSITENFSSLVKLIFLDQIASFIWLVLPLVFLVALGRKVSDPNEV